MCIVKIYITFNATVVHKKQTNEKKHDKKHEKKQLKHIIPQISN